MRASPLGMLAVPNVPIVSAQNWPSQNAIGPPFILKSVPKHLQKGESIGQNCRRGGGGSSRRRRRRLYLSSPVLNRWCDLKLSYNS